MFNFINNILKINYSKKFCNEHYPNILMKNNEIIFMKSLLIFPNIKNKHGETPLFTHTNIDIIKLLLEYGSNPNIQNNNGETPLFTHTNIDIIKLLLEYSSKPNIQNNNGETPLFYNYNIDVIKLLLEKGANPNIQNKYGHTSLFNRYNDINIIKLLMEYGVDIHHLNNKKQNVLFFNKNIEVLKFFVEKGVDIHQQDTDGKYAISYTYSKTDDIIYLLTGIKSSTKTAN